jgi:hypothetical protein
MKVDKKRKLGSSRCMSSGWLKGISAALHTQQDSSRGWLDGGTKAR